MKLYSQEIVDQFKAVKRKDGRWAIQLSPGRFLHWIEARDGSPCTVSNPDFSMQSWNFKAEANGIITWLKVFYTTGRDIGNVPVEVELDENGNEKVS